jgi:cyclin H
MTEDDLYRSSTQYRLWNFTPEKLASLRASTNAVATKSVTAAIKRKRAAKTAASSAVASATPSATASDADGSTTPARNGAGKTEGAAVEQPIECLTTEEEKKLVDFYCANMLRMGTQAMPLPIHVVVSKVISFTKYTMIANKYSQATAVQFLKRFYIYHSPMDYHPRQIMPTALFLATKTEGSHLPLADHFIPMIIKVPGLNKLAAEDVLAPEFVLTQGLRFCFDVRHPNRGLDGFQMELKLLIQVLKGRRKLPPGFTTKSDEEVKRGILQGKDVNDFFAIVDNGRAKAKSYLDKAALLSDVYFLYTPSQILFAAWYISQPDLVSYYLTLKLESTSAPAAHIQKILETVQDCATMLKAAETGSETDRQELTQIDKKLFKCRNPEKIDLVGLNKAQKRGGGVEGIQDENVAKKRKLAREKSEKEAADLFGPDLVK